ncbi:MAG TPA: hypothetical protein VF384_12510 [Planctomycetota bacterium]
MNRIAAGFASFVLSCATLAAQTPPSTPAGETTTAFTAAEAYAFACAQQIGAAWRQGAAFDLSQWVGLPGYLAMLASPSRGGAPGEMQFAGSEQIQGWQIDRQGGNGPALLGGEVLCYLVPRELGGGAKRVFCVRGDGIVAFTDNTAGTAAGGDRAPEPMDALGAGAADTLAAFPRTPGRGRDGNMWMPAEVVRQATARATVVDEDGAPQAMVAIAAVPADVPQEAIDAPIPAGIGRTLREGDATWTGVPAKGLAIELRVQGTKLRVAPSAVKVTGASLRVVVARAEIAKVALRRNEFAAIATLKNIRSAQAQCQASCAIDVNQNGAGEFGTFAELAGRDVVRGGTKQITPPVLSTAFSKVDGGVVVRSGYCFRMFLPGKDGAPVAELANGGPEAAAIDAAQAETTWCLYAWPVEPGVTGQRAFFVSQGGNVLASPNEDGRYAGKAKPPAPDAARAGGSGGKMGDNIAANSQGLDGQAWQVLN